MTQFAKAVHFGEHVSFHYVCSNYIPKSLFCVHISGSSVLQVCNSYAYGCNLYPTLPKPATYAHYGKEKFSLSMDSSINKLIGLKKTFG